MKENTYRLGMKILHACTAAMIGVPATFVILGLAAGFMDREPDTSLTSPVTLVLMAVSIWVAWAATARFYR